MAAPPAWRPPGGVGPRGHGLATTEPDSSLTRRPQSPASEGNPYGAVTWGSIGVFGVAAGLGVWSGKKAVLAQDEANECARYAETSGGSCSVSDYESHVDDSKSAALLADMAWAVAGIALVSTGVSIVLAANSSTTAVPGPWANIAVTPGGVMLDARF